MAGEQPLGIPLAQGLDPRRLGCGRRQGQVARRRRRTEAPAHLGVEGRRLERDHRRLQALERHDPARRQATARRRGQELGKRAQHRGPGARRLDRGEKGVERIVPGLDPGHAGARVVEYQEAEIEVVAQHGGEAALERRAVAPDGGVVVERVGDGGEVRQLRAQFPGLRLLERRKREAARARQIREHRGLAARAAHQAQPAALERSRQSEELERLQEPVERAHPGHAEAPEQGVVELGVAGQRSGVAERHARADLGIAALDRHDGHAVLERQRRRPGKGRNVGQALHVQADGADPWVLGERGDVVGEAERGLVADGNHVGDRQGAVLHGQVDAHVAALGHDGDAALDRLAAVRVRPQRRAVQVVERAEAVGPDQRHLAGRLDQPPLQLGPRGTDLGETGGVADAAAGPARGQRAHHLDARLGGHGDEGGVRGLGKFAHARVAGQAFDRLAARVDRPDLAGEADAPALANHGRRLVPTDDRDVAGAEQAFQVAPAPRGVRLGRSRRDTRHRIHRRPSRRAGAAARAR